MIDNLACSGLYGNAFSRCRDYSVIETAVTYCKPVTYSIKEHSHKRNDVGLIHKKKNQVLDASTFDSNHNIRVTGISSFAFYTHQTSPP